MDHLKKRGLFYILLLYHLCFTVAFHYYIMTNGGDSRAYWDFSMSHYRPATVWMDYFEYGNFFMQWLTYLPSQTLGLPYWSGNLIFSLLSFIGFAELMRMGLHHWGWNKSSLWKNAWILALFLPSAHFWTAGVGKEAILWLGTVWVLKGNSDPLKKGYWAVLGLFLTLMTRPIHGAILLAASTINLLIFKNPQKRTYKWLQLALLLGGGFAAFKILLRQTHLPDLTWESITEFFASQMQFLEGFDAATYIPMQTYSPLLRIWTVLFRPLPAEVSGLWGWAAAIENTGMVALTILGLTCLIAKRPNLKLPSFLIIGLFMGACMMLLFTVTLNNFGILLRMKSIFMPFFVLFLCQCTVFPKNPLTFGANNNIKTSSDALH